MHQSGALHHRGASRSNATELHLPARPAVVGFWYMARQPNGRAAEYGFLSEQPNMDFCPNSRGNWHGTWLGDGDPILLAVQSAVANRISASHWLWRQGVEIQAPRGMARRSGLARQQG
jgi:hypothetical protein